MGARSQRKSRLQILRVMLPASPPLGPLLRRRLAPCLGFVKTRMPEHRRSTLLNGSQTKAERSRFVEGTHTLQHPPCLVQDCCSLPACHARFARSVVGNSRPASVGRSHATLATVCEVCRENQTTNKATCEYHRIVSSLTVGNVCCHAFSAVCPPVLLGGVSCVPSLSKGPGLWRPSCSTLVCHK